MCMLSYVTIMIMVRVWVRVTFQFYHQGLGLRLGFVPNTVKMATTLPQILIVCIIIAVDINNQISLSI